MLKPLLSETQATTAGWLRAQMMDLIQLLFKKAQLLFLCRLQNKIVKPFRTIIYLKYN